MKQILIFITLVFSLNNVFGQVVKRKIGTSIREKENIVDGDSAISYILTYDTLGRLTSEWKVYIDEAMNISDTTFMKVDTANRETYIKTNTGETFFVYDSKGTLVSLQMQENDGSKTVIDYQPVYDKKGILVRKYTKVNLVKVNEPTIYKYKRGITFEITNSEDYNNLTKTKFNKKHQILFFETITESKSGETISVKNISKYRLDGNLKKYQSYKNGQLVKETRHFYEKGKEISQIENYLESKVKVSTVFRYEYY